MSPPAQNPAALAAADAFGRDPARLAEALERARQVQHDPVAAGANRMAEADRAAVDVEPLRRRRGDGTLAPEQIPTQTLVVPDLEAGEHLGGKGLVDLPEVDRVHRQPVALHQRSAAEDRRQPHDRGIERPPGAIADARERLEPETLHSGLGGQQRPAGAVGHLRGVAGRDLPVRALERRLQQAGPKARQHLRPLSQRVRLAQCGEPAHAGWRDQQRGMAQRLSAASEHQIGATVLDQLAAGIDRLHPGAAVDLHRERRHRGA